MANRYRSIVHHDLGCDLHPACLSCPRPLCRYDDPGNKAATAAKLTERNQEIARLYRSGTSKPELMQSYGLAKRTIERVINKARVGRNA